MQCREPVERARDDDETAVDAARIEHGSKQVGACWDAARRRGACGGYREVFFACDGAEPACTELLDNAGRRGETRADDEHGGRVFVPACGLGIAHVNTSPVGQRHERKHSGLDAAKQLPRPGRWGGEGEIFAGLDSKMRNRPRCHAKHEGTCGEEGVKTGKRQETPPGSRSLKNDPISADSYQLPGLQTLRTRSSLRWTTRAAARRGRLKRPACIRTSDACVLLLETSLP